MSSRHASRLLRLIMVLATAAGSHAVAQSGTAAVSGAEPYALPAVVERLRAHQAQALEQLEAREHAYAQRLSRAESRLSLAQTRLAELESTGRSLEGLFDDNKIELNEKAQLLNEKIGALKELFGVFQQNASDLIGAFITSPTSIEFPNRDVWLEGFANRMRNAAEVSSTEDIRRLWFELQREIAASDDIKRLVAEVEAVDGSVGEREIVRVGTFNLLDNGRQPEYLAWDTGTQRVKALARQPSHEDLAGVKRYVEADAGLHPLSVDPTGGALLGLLVERPTLSERVDQGGLVGYIILVLGAVALALALFKLLDLAVIHVRMGLQDRAPQSPVGGNPLGRLLLTWHECRNRDPETIQMRLHDRVAKESARVNRFTIFLAIIAAVAPLLGLLGTVVGMINTFQAITLYGTGDPQTMAGGISQALITTVLGLIVAVPAVLLHALVSTGARGLINVLQQHSAALSGDSIAHRSGGLQTAPPANMPPAAPAPA